MHQHVVGDAFDEDWKVLGASALGQELHSGSRSDRDVDGVRLRENGEMTAEGRLLRDLLLETRES